MIPVSILMRAFQMERACLAKTDQTLYARGIIQGLKLAEAIAHNVWKDAQGTRINNPMGITKKVNYGQK